jgi:DnaJ-domain-containing protein 1
MPGAFSYRPRFVDIRVRPPKAEAAAEADAPRTEAGERVCDHAGCRSAAATRAPKSRDMPFEHYWFCQAHAAEYNRNWNFFAGMSEAEVAERIADDIATGGRPTWSFKAGARNREAAASRGHFRDPTGFFAESQRRTGGFAPDARRLGKMERGALEDLDLELNADAAAIRQRYLELVKRCHPDANGGDRSSETRLQRVLRAYKTLQKARLV